MKNILTWDQIKDDVYGKVGTERRDQLEREAASFSIGLLLREAREKKTSRKRIWHNG